MCSICVLDAAERCLLATVNGKVQNQLLTSQCSEKVQNNLVCPSKDGLGRVREHTTTKCGRKVFSSVTAYSQSVRNLEFIALKECPVDSLATKNDSKGRFLKLIRGKNSSVAVKSVCVCVCIVWPLLAGKHDAQSWVVVLGAAVPNHRSWSPR